jgi:hypothetical protein
MAGFDNHRRAIGSLPATPAGLATADRPLETFLASF